MTNAEWIKQYPEDWHRAEDADKFPPDLYDFVWNDDYSYFRAVRLRYNSQASYIQFQASK